MQKRADGCRKRNDRSVTACPQLGRDERWRRNESVSRFPVSSSPGKRQYQGSGGRVRQKYRGRGKTSVQDFLRDDAC